MQVEVYRSSESAPSNFVKIGQTTSSYSTFLDQPVANEITWLYQVNAIAATGSCFSGVASTHPTTSRVLGANYGPVIYSAPITQGYQGIVYNYDVRATDPNANPLKFRLTNGPSGMTIDPFSGLIHWIPGSTGTYRVTLEVTDARGGTASQGFDVKVDVPATPNRAPAADAGPDQTVRVGDQVMLDGSGSTDPEGDLLTHLWTFVSIPPGSTAFLSDPTDVKPTFTVDQAGSYELELVVNDGVKNSAPDRVTITTVNSPPVADAGPDQTVQVGNQVQLDGGGSSDVDGDPLTYRWSLTSPTGSHAVLSDPSAVMPSFDIDLPGTYVAKLIVNDGVHASVPDIVVVTTKNTPPVADAGADQTVLVADTVDLDGSGSSDVDGDPLSYRWSLTTVPAGSSAALSDSSLANPSFIADLPGIYVAQLIVNDGNDDSIPDTVVISTANSRPVADAGADRNVVAGDTVTLDGGASSDADGDPLTFYWSLLSVPTGSTAVPSDPNAVSPTFQVDLAGTYVAQLIVNDGTVDSNPDTVTIVAGNRPPPANQAPTITSTPVTGATANQAYAYDVDATDPDSIDVLSYSLTTAPAGMTIDPATGLIQWTPTTNQIGIQSVTVRVQDPGGLFDVQTYSVTVVSPPPPSNQAPTITSTAVTSASVGQPYSYDVDATDPDTGDVLTYTLTIAPAGMTIDSVTGLILWTPDATQIGAQNVTVRVQDPSGLFAIQNYVVDVSSAPPPTNHAPIAVDDSYSVEQGSTLCVPNRVDGICQPNSAVTDGGPYVLDPDFHIEKSCLSG